MGSSKDTDKRESNLFIIQVSQSSLRNNWQLIAPLYADGRLNGEKYPNINNHSLHYNRMQMYKYDGKGCFKAFSSLIVV